MKEIVGFLVDLCVKHGFLNPGWEDRLHKSLEEVRVREYRRRDDLCSALAVTNKDGFVCCISAPVQKKLGDGSDEDMSEVCGACDRVRGMKDRIRRLEEERDTQKLLELPQCQRGGILQEDGSRFYCPISGVGYRTIQKCESMGCWGLKQVKFNFKGRIRDADHR